MKKLTIILFPFLIFACSKEVTVIDDFGDASFQLYDQDSSAVTFPDDYAGNFVVMGFIYTNCPDICSLITQNMIKIQKEMNYPEDVHFVAITFDPERDTPSVLKKYGEAFKTGENFNFLTGDSTQVSALLDSARVRTQVSFTQTTEQGEDLYFLNHSDKIMVLDKKSRVVIEYGGSQPMVPQLIIEELENIR